MIKVSIIVPVYNVEKYLEKCLDSIINQSLKEIEIICVNDCSLDKSLDILKKYKSVDDRVIIINNETNQRAGYSRNIGVERASGEYIGFIDSDDYIDEKYFEELYSAAKKYDSDIVNTNNIFYSYQDNTLKSMFDNILIDDFCINFNTDLIIESMRNWFVLKNYKIIRSICNKLWRKEFLKENNIIFLTNAVGEDLCFTLTALIHEPKISYNNRSIYYYKVYPRDVKYTIYDGILFDKSVTESIINYCKVNNSKYLKNIFNVMIGYMYSSFNELYRLETDKNKVVYDINLFFNKLNLNKFDLDKANIFLKSFYLDLKDNPSIKKMNYYIRIENIYRKICPPFLLKFLRIKNIIP